MLVSAHEIVTTRNWTFLCSESEIVFDKLFFEGRACVYTRAGLQGSFWRNAGTKACQYLSHLMQSRTLEKRLRAGNSADFLYPSIMRDSIYGLFCMHS
mmetsp:Transcript_946/g.1618  ORF Transcript_946/g.1618 Transcript_946/m.1618 type:complete len:98 (+) Transcript_946:585-878(+)